MLRVKSFDFAKRIIGLYKYLISIKKEYVLSKQVLRSGTSIGANIEEAVGGSSKKDFLNKLIISYKEARETIYWIRLLKETGYLEKDFADSIFQDCDEICAIIGKTRKTISKNI